MTKLVFNGEYPAADGRYDFTGMLEETSDGHFTISDARATHRGTGRVLRFPQMTFPAAVSTAEDLAKAKVSIAIDEALKNGR